MNNLSSKKRYLIIFCVMLCAAIIFCLGLVLPNILHQKQNQNVNQNDFSTNNTLVNQETSSTLSDNISNDNLNSDSDMPQNIDEVYNFNYDASKHSTMEYVSHAANIIIKNSNNINSKKNTNSNPTLTQNNQNINNFETTKNTDIYWYYNDNSKTLFLSNIKKDDNYQKLNQESVQPDWFQYNKIMEHVVIENNISPSKTAFWFSCTSTTGQTIASQITSIKNLSNINMSNVTDASFMFTGCKHLDDETAASKLGGGASSISNAFAMFAITNFNDVMYNGVAENLTSLENAEFLFSDCYNLEQINEDSISLNNCTSTSCMFCRDSKLQYNIKFKDDGYTPKNKTLSCMFYGCTTLTTAPKIITTNNLYTGEFKSMFEGCEKLTDASNITIHAAPESCCESMFSGCKSLSKLPSTAVVNAGKNAFKCMFKGCEALKELNSIMLYEIDASTCESMFEGCIALTTLPEISIEQAKESAYKCMFKGCKALVDASNITIKKTAVSCCESMFEDCTSLTKFPELDIDSDIAISAFKSMFKGCSAITTTPSLPLTLLGENSIAAFESIFEGCIALTEIPEISIEYVAESAYKCMFKGCKALVDASNITIKKTADSCYESMFEGCTSLEKFPKFDIGSNIAESSFKCMFKGCSAITTIPSLPLTWLSENSNAAFESMFEGCIALTTLPVISIEQANECAFKCMFKGCEALVDASKITIIKTANSCYESMFEGCTSLEEFPKFDIYSNITESSFKCMFKGCKSLETAPNINTIYGVDGYAFNCMFERCEKLTDASNITIHAAPESCCESMFNGCTSLTQAPVITANFLYENALKSMFENCNNLHEIKIKSTQTYSNPFVDILKNAGTEPSGSGYTGGIVYCTSELEEMIKSNLPTEPEWTTEIITLQTNTNEKLKNNPLLDNSLNNSVRPEKEFVIQSKLEHKNILIKKKYELIKW